MKDNKAIAAAEVKDEKAAGSTEKKDTATVTDKKDDKAVAKKDEKASESKDDVKDKKNGEVTDKKDDETGDDDKELNIDELFKTRKSVPLTPDNAKFTRSEGGLISLELKNFGEDAEERGEIENFERVIVLRAFPISNPDEFLSVREPDTHKKGRGKEIGIIRYITDFDDDTRKILSEELALRYFTPEIKKITNVKEKFGYSYWEAETTAGNVTFVLDNPFSNIRTLEDGRVFIADMDGNAFTVPDPEKLDKASLKRIEVYI